MSGRLPIRAKIPAKGLLLLAVGRKAGFDHFGTDTDAYLGSLAPLLALILVSCAWTGVHNAAPRHAASLFLRLICMLLAPVVIADLFCRVWKRAGQWALYANLLNWSQFLAWFVLVVLLFIAQLGVSAGANPGIAVGLAGLALLVYLSWFHWFLARKVLAVSRARVLMLLVISAMVTLAIGAVSLLGDQDSAGALSLPDSVAAPNGSTL